MAGTHTVRIITGYTKLAVRDLKYTNGSGEAASLDVFKPDSDRPLIMGEWLELNTELTCKRGGNNALASSPTPDNEGTAPVGLYFMEKGRTDVQVSKRAHLVQDSGYMIATKVFSNDTALVNGDKVSVWDIPYEGVVVRGLAKASSGSAFIVGRVVEVNAAGELVIWVGQG